MALEVCFISLPVGGYEDNHADKLTGLFHRATGLLHALPLCCSGRLVTGEELFLYLLQS